MKVALALVDPSLLATESPDCAAPEWLLWSMYSRGVSEHADASGSVEVGRAVRDGAAGAGGDAVAGVLRRRAVRDRAAGVGLDTVPGIVGRRTVGHGATRAGVDSDLGVGVR